MRPSVPQEILFTVLIACSKSNRPSAELPQSHSEDLGLHTVKYTLNIGQSYNLGQREALL